MTTPAGRLIRAHQLLRAIAAQSASTFANQIVAFIIPWLVLVRTGSALNAGTVAFATGIAAVVGTIGGGVIVDRIGARMTSLLSDALSLATVVAVPVALLADFLPLWFILATQTLGILFDGPGKVARDTLIPTTARHDDIPMVRAASLKESLQSVAMFVGPLAAGLLVAAAGASVTLLLAAAVFVVAVVLVVGIQHLTLGSASRDLREGFSFLLHEPLLGPLTLLLTAWVAVYVPLSVIVLPAWFIFAGQSASALGVFLGAQALGGVLGEIGFAAVGPRVRPWRWFVISSIVSKTTLAALLLTQPGSVTAIVVAFLTGLTAAGQLPIINTAYYTRTPAQLLGRVNGAGWALVLAALPVASLGFGWLVNITSPTTGILTVVLASAVMIAIFCLLPAMRLVDHQPPDTATSGQGQDRASPKEPQPEPATA